MPSFFTTLEKSLTTDFFSLGADSRCENVQRFRIVLVSSFGIDWVRCYFSIIGGREWLSVSECGSSHGFMQMC